MPRLTVPPVLALHVRLPIESALQTKTKTNGLRACNREALCLGGHAREKRWRSVLCALAAFPELRTQTFLAISKDMLRPTVHRRERSLQYRSLYETNVRDALALRA